MADIIPPGFAEITIPHRHALLARDALVTFGVSVPVTLTQANLNELQDVYDQSIGSLIDSQVSIGPAEAKIGAEGGEHLVIVGTDVDTGGAVRTDSINAGQALLIHKRTTRGGRRGRGRMYVPWAINDADVDEAGRILAGNLASFQAVAVNFLTGVEGATNIDAMVVLHSASREDVENPTAPGIPNVVTSLVVDSIVGTQRRRLGR